MKEKRHGKKCRKPLNRSILIGCVTFAVLLCAVLSIVNYINYRSLLYTHVEEHIKATLMYAVDNIDTDDLAECIRTGKESEKFRELQHFLDKLRDNADPHFIYVVIPLNTEPVDNMKNVIAGVSGDEYQDQDYKPVGLNMLSGDSYSSETAGKYLDAYNSGKLSFFEEVSKWGDGYTGLLPLKDSEGNPVAALCVDVDIQEFHTALRNQLLLMIFLTLAISVAFTALFIMWSRKNITDPIGDLEKGVTEFAEVSKQPGFDPDELVMNIPDIHTDNEVESLENAVRDMSVSMHDYVKQINEVRKELEEMNVLAHKDPLTHVGNKVAYDQFADSLDGRLAEETFEFAAIMADSNLLKEINDRYGHEQGDDYLRKCCKLICDIYVHSPVFRVGGDEFVVFLLGRDYENRDELLQRIRNEIARIDSEKTGPDWQKISVAVGMAVYDRQTDRSVREVVNRADQDMYLDKARMKGER